MTWQGIDDSQLDLFTAQDDKAACELADRKDNMHRCGCGIWMPIERTICRICEDWDLIAHDFPELGMKGSQDDLPKVRK